MKEHSGVQLLYQCECYSEGFFSIENVQKDVNITYCILDVGGSFMGGTFFECDVCQNFLN